MSVTKDLFQRLKKSKNPHLLIVEALVEADLMFVETQEMIYQIKGTVFDDAILFARTGKVQTRIGTKFTIHQGSFEELSAIMRGY